MLKLLNCHTAPIRSLIRYCQIERRLYSKKEIISSGYQPRQVEAGKANKWAKTVDSSANLSRDKQFIMIIPPPNVTGHLHLGHSLMATIQDVICRRKQQQGFQTIWIPGTDHAGIATQVVVEKQLFKESNKTRHQLGRDRFITAVHNWTAEKQQKIRSDLQKLGCVLRWDREYFTMDERQSAAVNRTFIELFESNLIERKNSLVNWSCSLESAVSDIEVESKEINGPTGMHVPNHKRNVIFGRLYDIAYKVSGSDDDEIVVSTTRPETLLGDVAVAVHPEDPRYAKYRQSNAKLWHPFRNEEIALIFDTSVEMEFGTGAVKITPAHDKNYFAIAARHNLNTELHVFTEKGTISSEYEGFCSLPRFEAREKIIEDLANLGLYKGMKDHKMILPLCSRSKDVIEYMLKPQWFLKCQDMANEAIKAVRDSNIQIHPKNFENEWNRWLCNSRDWCISRQLWWGHQIPAYLAKSNGQESWVAANSPDEALTKASHLFKTDKSQITIERDEDVLDTWFSSSLLPFSVFDWPNASYKNAYPLDLMVTGHDILFFWVARMVMLGQRMTGAIPFKNILLNGIICDAHGRKMSKSLGNVVMPDQVINGSTFDEMKAEIQRFHDSGILTAEEVKKSTSNLKKLFPNGIPECGTDALRFTLLSHNIKSHFINFDVSECHTNRLFFNKIWQATRYTLQSFEKLKIDCHTVGQLDLETLKLQPIDRWILSRLASTKNLCYQSFDSYNFHLGIQALKTFFYTNICDTYLETTKPEIQNASSAGLTHCAVLAACLSHGLQIMSSVTPFLADELLPVLPKQKIDALDKFMDHQVEREMDEILGICTAIRQYKSQYNILRKHQPKVHIFANNSDGFELLNKYKSNISILSQSHEVILVNGAGDAKQFSFFSTAGHLCSFGIETNEVGKESAKDLGLNTKKLMKLEGDLNKLKKTVSSEGYRKSANENVQKKHLERIKNLENEISIIKGMHS